MSPSAFKVDEQFSSRCFFAGMFDTERSVLVSSECEESNDGLLVISSYEFFNAVEFL